MNLLPQGSLRRRLPLLVFATCSLTLILACATLLAVDAVSARRADTRELRSLAELVADQGNAALAFEDARLADTILGSLRASPDVQSAVLFDRDGRPFRSYRRSVESPQPAAEPGPDGIRWVGSLLVATHPVTLERRRIGTAVLASDLGGSRSRLTLGIGVALGVLLASSLIAVALAIRLSRSVLEPILSLSAAMGEAARNRNFRGRVEIRSRDEVGDLVQVFNDMIAALRDRDAALERTASIIDATQDFVGIADPGGRVLFINPAARKMLEIPPSEEVRDLRIADFHPRTTGEKFESVAIPAAIRDGIWQGESMLLTRNGRTIPVAQVVVAHKDEQGGLSYLSTIIRDLSEVRSTQEALRRSEEQLRMAQKMEALGRLAGGIAHDFNNLLTVIGGHAQLLEQALPPGSTLAEHAERVVQAVERSSALTRQLLAFSRRQVVQPKVISLNSVVMESRQLLRRLIGETIELYSRLDPQLGRVRADAGQMEQVLMNLVVNARDAMPGGGRIEVVTSNTTLEAAEAASMELPRGGPYVTLSVTDTGAGMDAETLAHIFEPFFTTKERGRGTGLGLSTVYGIVRQSNGSVSVQSRVGAGSTFRILLPAVFDPLEADAKRNDAPRIVRGSEPLLVVEDEEGVRTLLKTALSQAGYRVSDHPAPAVALEALRREPASAVLVVSDVIMPGMSGPEMVRKMREFRPDLKVLYISGYPEDELGGDATLDEAADFLTKPFSTQQLATKVRALLDRVRPPAPPKRQERP